MGNTGWLPSLFHGHLGVAVVLDPLSTEIGPQGSPLSECPPCGGRKRPYALCMTSVSSKARQQPVDKEQTFVDRCIRAEHSEAERNSHLSSSSVPPNREQVRLVSLTKDKLPESDPLGFGAL